MINPLFSFLQFAGGTFPTGAFSQSWGLETYVESEQVNDEEAFKKFLKMYIDNTLEKFEGPIFAEAYELAQEGKVQELEVLDREFTAMRLTKETREIALKIGRAFLRIGSEMFENDKVRDFYSTNKDRGVSFPIAFAFIFASLGLDKAESLKAFMFSTVSGLIQSGLKLIPLGNLESQKILFSFYEDISLAADRALKISSKDAFVFCPGLDIASMNHEVLPTRLYMT